MNQQVKYMLRTYEFFIIHSLIIIFIIQPSPSNKKSAYPNLLQSYFEVIFCEKIVVRMKNVKFRGEKTNSVAQFRGPNSAVKTQIPRRGAKFGGARKTVGPTDKYPPPLYIYIYIYIYIRRGAR